jgi:hypothetical protein
MNHKLGGEDACRVGKRGPGGDLQDRPYAESWKAAGDTEFKLRRDVNFSDGDPFTAKDFAGAVCRMPLVKKSPSSLTILHQGRCRHRGVRVQRSRKALQHCLRRRVPFSSACPHAFYRRPVERPVLKEIAPGRLPASNWPQHVGKYRGRLPSFAR